MYLSMLSYGMRQLDNILLATSNASAVVPLTIAMRRGDTCTSVCIAAAAGMSFWSHALQSHKFGLPGFGTSPSCSRVLNAFDVAAATVLALRVLWILAHHDYLRWVWSHAVKRPLMFFLLAGVLNILGARTQKRKAFVILHSLWHIAAFLSLGDLLRHLLPTN